MLESPIDFTRSNVVTQPKGFKSCVFNSSYICAQDSASEIDYHLSQISDTSDSASRALASSNIASSVSHRIGHAKSRNSGFMGTLLISVFSTSQNVRVFNKICWDEYKLRNFSGKNLNIITEVNLGGVFIGMIHIYSGSATSDQVKENFKQMAEKMKTEQLFPQTSSDIYNITNIFNTRVEIEFISYGAHPTFTRHNVNFPMFDFKNLNPSLSVDNAQSIITNAIRETIAIERPQKIHSIESLYEAYESFNERMLNDVNAGFPIGYNYRSYSNIEIDQFLHQFQLNQLNQRIEDYSRIQKAASVLGDRDPLVQIVKKNFELLCKQDKGVG